MLVTPSKVIDESWVLRVPTDILTMVLTQWMSLNEISRLDLCVSHLHTRKKFLDIISGGSVIFDPPTPKKIANINYYSWLFKRNISVRTIRTAYKMDEMLPLYLQEKVCRHLRKLDFSSSIHEYIDLPAILSYCPYLEELLLCESTLPNVVNAKVFDSIVQHGTNLRVFDLHSSRELNADIVLKLVKGCKKLRELHFQYCYGVCDVALAHIAEHCTQLTRLTIRTNESITSAGLLHVVQHCPQLTHLVIPACNRVTSAGVSEMSVFCARLSHLNLKALSVRDAALESIASHCPRLQCIIVTSCCFITHLGVLAMVEKCEHLQTIDVRYCYNVKNIESEVQNLGKSVKFLNGDEDM